MATLVQIAVGCYGKKSMRFLRALRHPGGAFLLGAVSVMAFALIWTGADPHAPWKVIPPWGIFEDPRGVLRIPIAAPQPTILDIHRDESSGRVQLLFLGRKDLGGIFEYKAEGAYDCPVVEYSGMPTPFDWITWIDLNADGWFDECFRETGYTVRSREGWLRVVEKDGHVETDNGRYAFRPEAGYWVRTDGEATREPTE